MQHPGKRKPTGRKRQPRMEMPAPDVRIKDMVTKSALTSLKPCLLHQTSNLEGASSSGFDQTATVKHLTIHLACPSGL